ncbi:hypothetical protein T03_2535 [Trichinella britovi]|uniref:Uncharacterized protein n=1 Tax=Trichinella britovi TaxID=45882 RepID=A0A0V1DEA4_TRIBR|nr:hypothetical protein T03_2535 [Trichinella britovi]
MHPLYPVHDFQALLQLIFPNDNTEFLFLIFGKQFHSEYKTKLYKRFLCNANKDELNWIAVES